MKFPEGSYNQRRAQVEKILEDLGIELQIGGCGCCGSPWVEFKYKGELLLDDDNVSLETNSVQNLSL